MYPIFVLEGPDNSGKTTLGKYLAEKMNAKYLHLTYRFKDQMFHYHTAALELALKWSRTRPVIIDRWWPSINIYDAAFRGKLRNPYAGRLLDRVGLMHNIIYVACIPSNREEHERDFKTRANAGGEMFDEVGRVSQLYRAWYDLVEYRSDVVKYDRFTDGRDLDGFTDRLEQYAYDMAPSPARLTRDSNRAVAGQLRSPTYLIIGEQSNSKHRRKVWPFFENGYSSLWLTKVLEQCGIPETKIAWINAFDQDGWAQHRLIYDLAIAANPVHVLALGNKAYKTASVALGYSSRVDKLPHPAYVKRFQNGDPTDYFNYFKGEDYGEYQF